MKKINIVSYRFTAIVRMLRVILEKLNIRGKPVQNFDDKVAILVNKHVNPSI